MTDDINNRRVPRFKHPYEAYTAQLQGEEYQENRLRRHIARTDTTVYLTADTAVGEEDKIANAVDPKHYKLIPPEAYERCPDGLQYQDLMFYLLEGHEPRVSNLLAQVYKYLVRAGKKDDIEQELKKAKWYLDYLLDTTLPYVKTFYTDADLYEQDEE